MIQKTDKYLLQKYFSKVAQICGGGGAGGGVQKYFSIFHHRLARYYPGP